MSRWVRGTGAVVRDPVQDSIAWREYLEVVVRERDGWDVVQLGQMLRDSPTAAMLTDLAAGSGCPCCARISSR